MQLYRQACDATELSAIRSLTPFYHASSLALRVGARRDLPYSCLQAVSIPGNWKLFDPVHRTMYWWATPQSCSLKANSIGGGP
jgi:hypothetical protein